MIDDKIITEYCLLMGTTPREARRILDKTWVPNKDEEAEVLDAMSVIPIAWLRAGDIAGEMHIHGNGQQIIGTLKSLLAKGLVKRERWGGQWGKQYWWRLSDEEEERVEKAWQAIGGPSK